MTTDTDILEAAIFVFAYKPDATMDDVAEKAGVTRITINRKFGSKAQLLDKAQTYTEVGKQIAAVIDGELSAIARYASAACLLSEAFPYYFWTGFYLVDPHKKDELVVGPYQGSLGCLRIPFGRGVCGAAAAQRKTIIVKDVHKFEGHIACDSRSNSEIVVPVFWENGDLAAVLDADSEEFGAFDEVDRVGLEAVCEGLLIEVITK